MSPSRQPLYTLAAERYLIVRTMLARCAPGLRTTSPTAGWHRLISAARGIILVRTPERQWSAPPHHAVWVPAGVRAEVETCVETELQVFYLRAGRARWSRGLPAIPAASRSVSVGPLLRQLLARVADLTALDRRDPGQVATAMLILQEVGEGAEEPLEVVWPQDARAARIATIVQTRPGDQRGLTELCRKQGVSPRTVQRLCPQQTGLTFDHWRARVRFLHAARLLTQGRKVSEAAMACGYRSPSAFIQAFTRFAGATPAQFARG